MCLTQMKESIVSSPLNNMLVEQLRKYTPHTLESLHNAALMSRVDSKFIVRTELLPSLLNAMIGDYSVLEIDSQRSFGYLTTYYDTPIYDHYRHHHNSRPNRYKIRKRTYTQSNACYLEVKFKDRTGRTTKIRQLSNAGTLVLEGCEHLFLSKSGVPDTWSLKPVQTGSYRRIALANEEFGERLTIDCNLEFHSETSTNHHALGSWVIVELKQNELRRGSAFFKWAKSHSVRESSFSKYCMGVYFTGPLNLIRNNFHSTYRTKLEGNSYRANSNRLTWSVNNNV